MTWFFGQVMKDVAMITRITPQARMENIGKFVKRVRENPEAMKVLTDWGLSLVPAPVNLQAR